MTTRQLTFALLMFALLPSASATAEERKHTPDPIDKVKQLVDEDKAILIDVRELKEWRKGHIVGATLLPLSVLGKAAKDSAALARLLEDLPKDKPIYVHCASGHRCLLACDVLEQAQGYDFRPLKPGYKDLVVAGFAHAEGD
ncbi:MAG: rhodanese-like domain-containing protein [Pirellulales bacterium]|nr:rhodanese-like domain-containing protein [Pirellulales bacterium]